MPWQKGQRQVLVLDGLSCGQCLGGLLGPIFYGFGCKKRHHLWSIFGQVLKQNLLITLESSLAS